MTTLAYGLNITKKKNPPTSTRPLPGKRKAVFGDDSDDDEVVKDGDAEVEVIEEIGGVAPPSNSKSSDAKAGTSKQIPKQKKDVSTLYGSLSAKASTLKHSSTAIEIDPTIYDYDAVYDSLHANTRKKKAAQDGEKKPQYMEALLAAAEVRKRDQLRAKEKLLHREREAEGDEFADKEMFVTEAYKLQQAELLKVEAEETAREEREAERRRREGGGMAGFYKKLLDQGEKAHIEAVAAAEAAIPNISDEAPEQPKEKSEAEMAQELMEKKGGVIAVNDDGQIVDKRQLLSAGLNIVAKPKSAATASSKKTPSGSRNEPSQYGLPGRGGGQKAMRERQSRMIEDQLEQATKRAADEEADKARELERTSKSHKTREDISSAKERYLQRKREAAEAAKAK